ncbi:MAG: hypothetical protein SCK28_03455 [Bacillota bacterium]|nr:hypothetical protein [Bacillota bacterium]
MKERLSYDLSMEMCSQLAKEFDIELVTDKFAQELKGTKEAKELAREIFASYGKKLAKRTLELGQKYTDQTYENMKEVAKQVPRVAFPHIPQRFIEIGYLSTHPFETLAVEQNNHYALIFKIEDCVTYNILAEKCGKEVARALPCQEACIAFNKGIYEGVDLPAKLEIGATMPRQGYCRFIAINENPEKTR